MDQRTGNNVCKWINELIAQTSIVNLTKIIWMKKNHSAEDHAYEKFLRIFGHIFTKENIQKIDEIDGLVKSELFLVVAYEALSFALTFASERLVGLRTCIYMYSEDSS